MARSEILFHLLPDGFRSVDLRRRLADPSGRSADTITQGAVTYQLRQLRLHGMIERLPNDFRYRMLTVVSVPLCSLPASITGFFGPASPLRFHPNSTQRHHQSSAILLIKLDTFG